MKSESADGNSSVAFDVAGAIKLLGRPVAFYPSIAKIFGIKESLIVCQLLYWTPKADPSNGEGWIFKSSEEMEFETGLTYREQFRARRNLIDLGILEERHERLNHRLFFRVNLGALNEALRRKNDFPETTFGRLGKRQTVGSPNDERSEGTIPSVVSHKEAEITHRVLHRIQKPSPPASEGDSQPTKPLNKAVEGRLKKYKAFIEIIDAGYKKKGLPFTWGASEGKQLKTLLRDCPAVTEDQFRLWLNNRARSEKVNMAARPREWLGTLPRYNAGPLDEFGKPKKQEAKVVNWKDNLGR